MILRREECVTEERKVRYGGEESVVLRRGECDTEGRRVCY